MNPSTLGLAPRDVKQCWRFAQSECTAFREGRDLRPQTEYVRKVLDCLRADGRAALAAAGLAPSVADLDHAAADAVLAAFPALATFIL